MGRVWEECGKSVEGREGREGVGGRRGRTWEAERGIYVRRGLYGCVMSARGDENKLIGIEKMRAYQY